MGFDPYNNSLKIWESIETPIPKVRVHLGSKVWMVIPSHFLTFSHTLGCMKYDSWISLLTRTFKSPCFGRESKAKVATPLVVD